MFTIVLCISTLLVHATAHGVLKTPSPRTSGTAQITRCGSAVSSKLNSDPAGPIENAMKKADADYNCNAYLCRGYQFEDNVGRVQVYSAGQTVPFLIDLVAAHRPGWANVSVVDLETNRVIGVPVKSWNVWPDDISGGGDDVDFNVTISTTLGSSCDVGGKCALQWYWWSNSNSQTYESCVDFYVK